MSLQRGRKQLTKELLYHLKRWSIWLRRVKYSRGFGVQSPSAYQFIRYVLTEHYPYYAYATLRHRHHNEGHAVQKRGRLFFRLANYLQAKQWFHAGDKADVYANYVNEGCSKTQFLPLDEAQLPTTFSVASLPLTQQAFASPVHADFIGYPHQARDVGGMESTHPTTASRAQLRFIRLWNRFV